MLPEKIIFQSAGSLSVGIIAFLMLILQILLFSKNRESQWYAWSAAISFSALIYAIGIFIEYNTLPGSLNRFSGLLEWAALILSIHSMFGFTFSYLGIDGKKYHMRAGVFHGFTMLMLWTTDYLVSDQYTAWDFIDLDSPYVEPSIGPLGPLFIFYIILSAISGMIVWFRHKRTDVKYRSVFISGMAFWILLGIHDGLAVLGVPTFQYMMEYGFLGFSLAVLWVVINSYMETEADEKYRIITEYANECIVIARDRKVVFGNPAFCELIGQPLSNDSAAVFSEMMLPEDRETYQKIKHSILEGNNVLERHTVCVQKDGNGRFLEIVISAIKYRGRPAVLMIMRDITEQKHETEALREAEEKLARSKKMESMGLLAGGVAHDLNNVLSGIINYPELMLMDMPEDSRLRKPLEGMKAAGERAVAIVQDLLTVARGVAVQQELLNINDIITDYLDSPEYEKFIQFHQLVTVICELDPDLGNVYGSSIHIRKVIMNLVSNASEAIKETGKVLISTMNCRIEAPVSGYEVIEAGEYVLLSVSDDGSGILMDDRERLFEPFYTKKVMGRSGTGLGLAVVWNIMQDHKGHIDIVSDENGTRFMLYFPLKKQGIEKKTQPVPVSGLKGNGETILVVDDVDSQREITCDILSRLDYHPVAVSSGEDAVEYMRTHSADLMVVDMIMDPGINGRETYERIIKDHPGQKAIVISGFAETDDVKMAIKLGCGKYVRKPFSLKKLGLPSRMSWQGDKAPRCQFSIKVSCTWLSPHKIAGANLWDLHRCMFIGKNIRFFWHWRIQYLSGHLSFHPGRPDRLWWPGHCTPGCLRSSGWSPSGSFLTVSWGAV